MAEIRADEISRILREQIKGYGKKVEISETGTVLSTGDGHRAGFTASKA